MQEEFEDLKDKVKYEGGRFLNNERKENEILILRQENSILKREISKFEKLQKLNETLKKDYMTKIDYLQSQIEQLNKTIKKYQESNLNINKIDDNNKNKIEEKNKEKEENIIKEENNSEEANNFSNNNNKIIVTFLWTEGGYDVKLTGSFCEWKTKINMDKDPNDNTFKFNLPLDNRIYQFKFIVDGEWRCSEKYPTEKDGFGNINNFIDLTNYVDKKEKKEIKEDIVNDEKDKNDKINIDKNNNNEIQRKRK